VDVVFVLRSKVENATAGNGTVRIAVTNSSMGSDPKPGIPKNLVVTFSTSLQPNVQQLTLTALSADCYANIVCEEELQSGVLLPLPTLPPTGQYILVYVRGSGFGRFETQFSGLNTTGTHPNTCVHYATMQPKYVSSSVADEFCAAKIFGTPADINIIGFLDQPRSKFLSGGVQLGANQVNSGSRGSYGPVFDSANVYCLMNRSAQMRSNDSGLAAVESQANLGLGFKTRVFKSSGERLVQGDVALWPAGEEMFLAASWPWACQSMRGDILGRWRFTPISRLQPDRFRMEQWQGKLYHLAVDSGGAHNRGMYRPRMIELTDKNGITLEQRDQHVWKLSLDVFQSRECGRRVWNICYAGPSQEHLGWVLSALPRCTDVMLFDPAFTNASEGRYCGWEESPTAWELVENTFSECNRPPRRSSDQSSKDCLVNLQFSVPLGSDQRVNTSKYRNPFYLREEEPVNKDGEESCTFSTISARRVPNSWFTVHYCEGKSLDGSIGSIRVPTTCEVLIRRMVASSKSWEVDDGSSSTVTFSHADDTWLAIVTGGFSISSKCSVSFKPHDVDVGLRVPPGGSLILAMAFENARPVPQHPVIMASDRDEQVVLINGIFNQRQWSRHWLSCEYSDDPLVNRGDRGWVEYSVHFDLDCFVNISVLYACRDSRPVSLSVNGEIVDCSMCTRRCRGVQREDAIWWKSFSGPYFVKKGVTHLKFINDRYVSLGRTGLPKIFDIAVSWRLPNETLLRTISTQRVLRLHATATDQAKLKPSPADGVSTAPVDRTEDKFVFHQLPDAFGVIGAIALSPTGTNSLLTCIDSFSDRSELADGVVGDRVHYEPRKGRMLQRADRGVVGKAVAVQKVPHRVLQRLRVGSYGARDRVVVLATVVNDGQRITYIRFDYSSGECRSHGLKRAADTEQKYKIPVGSFIKAINVWNDPDKLGSDGAPTVRVAMQLEMSNGDISPVLGVHSALQKSSPLRLRADAGNMICWLNFNEEGVCSDQAVAISGPLFQVAAEPVGPGSLDQCLMCQFWARVCAFYPHPDKC